MFLLQSADLIRGYWKCNQLIRRLKLNNMLKPSRRLGDMKVSARTNLGIHVTPLFSYSWTNICIVWIRVHWHIPCVLSKLKENFNKPRTVAVTDRCLPPTLLPGLPVHCRSRYSPTWKRQLGKYSFASSPFKAIRWIAGKSLKYLTLSDFTNALVTPMCLIRSTIWSI